jgi:hypothetical protein
VLGGARCGSVGLLGRSGMFGGFRLLCGVRSVDQIRRSGSGSLCGCGVKDQI